MYTKKSDNLVEMDKFLEPQNLLWLNHEEIKNLNKPVTNKCIESVIKNLPTKKSPWLDGFTGEFYQVSTNSNFSEKLKETPHLPCEANITLIPKLSKDYPRKLQTNTCYEHWCKNPQQNTSKQFTSILKELCTVTVEFHPGRQGLFSIGKLTSAIYYIRKVKEKRSHMVISIDGGKKHLTKFNSLFMMKILNKIEIERLP